MYVVGDGRGLQKGQGGRASWIAIGDRVIE
jgi:hypothetical protein